mmetsp:Transcript_55072/g.129263  ORF Transcript_55072/g.129263 Transcript_55072/m.129263 type:complete len:288 (-) Transcript_55072:22-885(-)
MSWYVGHDGRQVWVEARETVFTCDKPEDELPTKQLTYLTSNLQKTVFAEHAVDDLDGKKGKKKDKQAGRQRGFIVRVDQDERVNVLPSVQAAVDKLQSSGAVSRVDLDETEGKKRNKKGRDIDEAKETTEEPEPGLPLGVNECRVETVARCQHQAHGVGFTILVSEGSSKQRIHCFTASREVKLPEWHDKLMKALAADGTRVLMGRMSPALAPPPPDSEDVKARKEAAKEEDDWLDSLMGRCMVSDKEARPSKAAAAGSAAGAAAGYSTEEAPAAKAVQVPPWLRRR